jgi:subtilisin family serine protease
VVVPQEDGIVRYAAKRLILLFLCFSTLTTQALASTNYLVIVDVASGANVKDIASAYNGKVLDALSTNKYLMKVKLLTPKYPVSGVEHIELDVLVKPGRGKGGVVAVRDTTRPDWYFSQPALKLIGIDQARPKTTGAGKVIADINSAVDHSHPALRGRLIAGYDFIIGRPSDLALDQSSASFLDQSSASFLDQSSASFLDQSSASFLDQSSASFLDQSSASFLDSTNPAHGHGTIVAGILAAVAPGAMIMPIRAFDDRGESDHFTIAKAIYWAVDHGADVINMSFGTLEKSEALKEAIEYADKNGVTLVSSAGNDDSEDEQYPSRFDKVIAVAATDLWDMKARFSNYGKAVDVSAPGVAIIAPYPGGYYAVVSGTSFAAPIVAGEAALLQSFRQKENVKNPIKKSTIKIDHRNPGRKMGEGRISLPLALEGK